MTYVEANMFSKAVAETERLKNNILCNVCVFVVDRFQLSSLARLVIVVIPGQEIFKQILVFGK